MKSTIATNPPHDSNLTVAGHKDRHVRNHVPWLRAITVIASRFVLASTLVDGICRLFLSSARHCAA